MTSPLERAARALWNDREQHQHPRCRQMWEQGSETACRFAMSHARAVIEAIREPSDEMLAAGVPPLPWGHGDPEGSKQELALAWQMMIDKLLAGGGDGQIEP